MTLRGHGSRCTPSSLPPARPDRCGPRVRRTARAIGRSTAWRSPLRGRERNLVFHSLPVRRTELPQSDIRLFVQSNSKLREVCRSPAGGASGRSRCPAGAPACRATRGTCPSVTGVANLNSELINQQIVILGYSQGGAVVSTELSNLAGLDQTTKDRISVVTTDTILAPPGLWTGLTFLPTIDVFNMTFGPTLPTNI